MMNKLYAALSEKKKNKKYININIKKLKKITKKKIIIIINKSTTNKNFPFIILL